ncbi:MAG TPA: hypothetical protein PLV58_01485 [Campylobacterales bacterium]|nr:hypothetical protein [Campylobacterales bacterium]
METPNNLRAKFKEHEKTLNAARKESMRASKRVSGALVLIILSIAIIAVLAWR